MQTPLFYKCESYYSTRRSSSINTNYFEQKGIPINNKIIKNNSINVNCLLTNNTINKIINSKNSWIKHKENKLIDIKNVYFIFADAGISQLLPYYIKPFGSTCSIIVHNNKEIYKEKILINNIKDNNQAELIAVLTALIYIKQNLKKKEIRNSVFIIASDSRLVLDQISTVDSLDNMIKCFDYKVKQTRMKEITFFESDFKEVLIKFQNIIDYFKDNLYTVWVKGHQEEDNIYLNSPETSFYVDYNDKCDTICSKLIYDRYKEINCLKYMTEDRQNKIIKKYQELIKNGGNYNEV